MSKRTSRPRKNPPRSPHVRALLDKLWTQTHGIAIKRALKKSDDARRIAFDRERTLERLRRSGVTPIELRAEIASAEESAARLLVANKKMTTAQLQDELLEALTQPTDDNGLAFDFSSEYFVDVYLRMKGLRKELSPDVDEWTDEQRSGYAAWLRGDGSAHGIGIFMQDDPTDVPAAYHFSDTRRLPKGTWLIHHSRERFSSFDRGATFENLALSTWNRKKPMAGPKNLDDEIGLFERVYAFAFEPSHDPYVGRDGRPMEARVVRGPSEGYGPYMTLFQTDAAVEAYHDGDMGWQAVFPVGTEYNMHALAQDGDEWSVEDDRGDEHRFETLAEVERFFETRRKKRGSKKR